MNHTLRQTDPLRELAAPELLGIVYCSSINPTPGRELEKLADDESVETASAVKTALDERCRVELLDLATQRIGDIRKFDWVFNLGETTCGFPLADYEIARIMEAMGMHFTGAGSAALQACGNKPIAKARLCKLGILTPAFEVVKPGDAMHNHLVFPLIVKPAHEDGGVGIFDDSIVHDLHQLVNAVDRIHSVFSQAALVEEYIEGRDITASILGNGDTAIGLPPSECIYPDPSVTPILTFASNWVPTTRGYQTIVSQCPCNLDEGTTQSIKEIAMQVYKAMGCRDYARVDFRLKENTPYVLEVNPNPCISPTDSGFVRAGEAVGMDYKGIINRILDSSLQTAMLENAPVFKEQALYEDRLL